MAKTKKNERDYAAFRRDMAKRLDGWKVKLDRFRAEATRQGRQAEDGIDRAIALLEERGKETARMLDRLGLAGQRDLEGLVALLENAWTELEARTDEVAARFQESIAGTERSAR